jgi:hypothetical protein
MPEGMQHDFASKNIVAQAVVSPPHAPLPFTRFQSGEFLDFVSSAAVLGIVAENLNQFFEGSDQGGGLLADCSKSPLECGGGEDSKRSGYDVSIISLLLLLALAARSFQFSQKCVCTARRSAAIFRRARLDLLLYRAVLHFQVIFEIVYVHEAHDGDAVLLQDEEFVVDVHAAHNLA